MRRTIAGLVLAGTFALGAFGYADIIIRTAPPAPVSVAVVGRAPSSKYIWIPGYYNGVNGRYVWVPGKWIIPPRHGAVWIPPRWIQKPNGYLFVAGHWR